MEDLAERDGMVAELVEMLGHGHDVGDRLPKLLAEAPDPG
jgi:hypothetical protein